MWEYVEQYGWYGLAVLVALYAAWQYIMAAVDRAQLEPAASIGASRTRCYTGHPRAPHGCTVSLYLIFGPSWPELTL